MRKARRPVTNSRIVGFNVASLNICSVLLLSFELCDVTAPFQKGFNELVYFKENHIGIYVNLRDSIRNW